MSSGHEIPLLKDARTYTLFVSGGSLLLLSVHFLWSLWKKSDSDGVKYFRRLPESKSRLAKSIEVAIGLVSIVQVLLAAVLFSRTASKGHLAILVSLVRHFFHDSTILVIDHFRYTCLYFKTSLE